MLGQERESSSDMGAYRDELTRTMTYLSSLPNTVFIGQAVEVPGTAMTGTLENVDKARLLEFPVEEDFQLGVSVGLAMQGLLPVSIFPRWNFLLLATNQIVNHLDKLSELLGETPPKVPFIRDRSTPGTSPKRSACWLRTLRYSDWTNRRTSFPPINVRLSARTGFPVCW
jgi:hypothetical protein